MARESSIHDPGGEKRLNQHGDRAARKAGRVLRAAAGILVALPLSCTSWTSAPYYPDKEVRTEPSQVGLPYQAVTFRATDNVRLTGWWVPAGKPMGTVLFCHGNAGNISNCLGTLRVFNGMGLDVLVFDYRGYGRSEGRPSEEGLYRDAEAAWRYLTEVRKVPAQRIVIVGRSLGGPVAAHLARDHRSGALVLESTFTSMDEEVSKLSTLPVGSLVKGEFRTEAYVSEVRCPVLVVHSREDEVVPYELGRKVFEAAKGPKEFLEITGTHNGGYETSGKLYREGWERFLGKFVSKQTELTAESLWE